MFNRPNTTQLQMENAESMVRNPDHARGFSTKESSFVLLFSFSFVVLSQMALPFSITLLEICYWVYQRHHTSSLFIMSLIPLVSWDIWHKWGFPWWLSTKESACSAGDTGLITGLGRSPGGGHDNSLQYSCLKNPMDRGAWHATIHWVPKSWTWLKRLNTHAWLK